VTYNDEQNRTGRSKSSRPAFESGQATTKQGIADEPRADSHQNGSYSAAEKEPNPAEKETSLSDAANTDSGGKSGLSPETYSVSRRRSSRRYRSIKAILLSILESAARSTYARLVAMLLVSCALEGLFRLIAHGVPETSATMCYFMRIGRGVVWSGIVRELSGSMSVSVVFKNTKVTATREVAGLLLGFTLGFNMPC
jgi:hypothetical protein